MYSDLTPGRHLFLAKNHEEQAPGGPSVTHPLALRSFYYFSATTSRLLVFANTTSRLPDPRTARSDPGVLTFPSNKRSKSSCSEKQLARFCRFSSDRTLFNSRASPRCWRRLRLRPHTLHQGDGFKETLLDRSTNLGRVGRAQARPASLRAIRLFSFLECSPLHAPSRAATPLCPENGRYHSTSISY